MEQMVVAPYIAPSKRVIRRYLETMIRDRLDQSSSWPRNGDLAEQPMFFIIDAGGEEQRVRRPGGGSIPEAQGPESVNRQRLAVGTPQQAGKASVFQIKHSDLAATKLAHQQGVADANPAHRTAEGIEEIS